MKRIIITIFTSAILSLVIFPLSVKGLSHDYVTPLGEVSIDFDELEKQFGLEFTGKFALGSGNKNSSSTYNTIMLIPEIVGTYLTYSQYNTFILIDATTLSSKNVNNLVLKYDFNSKTWSQYSNNKNSKFTFYSNSDNTRGIYFMQNSYSTQVHADSSFSENIFTTNVSRNQWSILGGLEYRFAIDDVEFSIQGKKYKIPYYLEHYLVTDLTENDFTVYFSNKPITVDDNNNFVFGDYNYKMKFKKSADEYYMYSYNLSNTFSLKYENQTIFSNENVTKSDGSVLIKKSFNDGFEYYRNNGFHFKKSNIKDAFYSFYYLQKKIYAEFDGGLIYNRKLDDSYKDFDYFCTDGSSYSNTPSIHCSIEFINHPDEGKIIFNDYYTNVKSQSYFSSFGEGSHFSNNHFNSLIGSTFKYNGTVYPENIDEYFSSKDIYDSKGVLKFQKNDVYNDGYYLRKEYRHTDYDSLSQIDFEFKLSDFYSAGLGGIGFKIKDLMVDDLSKIDVSSMNVYFRNKDTRKYGVVNEVENYFFPTSSYDDENNSLLVLYQLKSFMELRDYDMVRFSFDFLGTKGKDLDIYSNVMFGEFNLISGDTFDFSGYKKVFISSAYQDYVLSANESKSFKIIANRDNVLNLTEGDLIVLSYNFNIPIYSRDENYPNAGMTLTPYGFSSYLGYYNDYVEFYVTLDYSKNKLVLLRNQFLRDFYVWIPEDIFISPVKEDGSYDFLYPGSGEVSGNGNSNNKDILEPGDDEENFFSFMVEGISYFLDGISYIFSLISRFFNGLTKDFQLYFVTLFFLSLSVFIVRFLL